VSLYEAKASKTGYFIKKAISVNQRFSLTPRKVHFSPLSYLCEYKHFCSKMYCTSNVHIDTFRQAKLYDS